MTFSDMQTRVGELINQSVSDNTKTVTNTEVKAYLNIGYKKAKNAVVSVNESYYTRLAKADLVANQATYSLPDDSRKIRRVEVGYDVSTTRYEATRLDRNSKPDPNTSFNQGAPVFYIVGDSIELDPTPDTAVTDGLWLWYLEDVGDMVNASDEPNLPQGYDYTPIFYAVAKAKQRLGLEGEAQAYLAEFNTELEVMKREIIGRGVGDNDYVKIVDWY